MKPNFALLVLLLASLACNAALGGQSTPKSPPIPVGQPPTTIASPTQTPGNLTPGIPTSTPETPSLTADTQKPDTLTHQWASRSFSDPEDLPADPDWADGKPDVTDCSVPMLTTWAPPASDQPQALPLTYTTPLMLQQVNLYLVGNPQEILRIEALNSQTGLGRLIYDHEQPVVKLPNGKTCPVQVSLPASLEFEVDTVIIHTAASQKPLQIDAVEMVGELKAYLDAPVFWRMPLTSTPRSLAVGQNGLVYVVTADGSVQTFDLEGNQFPALSLPAGVSASQILADPFGSLVVIDDEKGQFFVLSPEGKLLASGGEDLFGSGAISPVDGNLYLLMGSAIQIYTIDTGDFVQMVPLDDLHSYVGLAIDQLGALYTVRDYDWDPAWVQLTPSTGQEMNAMPLKTSQVVDNVASALAIDGNGNFYVLFSTNTGSIAVHKLDPQGNLLSRFGKLDYDTDPIPEGSFFEPRAIAVSPDGRFIFITDGYDEKSHLTAFLLEPEE